MYEMEEDEIAAELYDLGLYMEEVVHKDEEEEMIFQTSLSSLGMSWRDFY